MGCPAMFCWLSRRNKVPLVPRTISKRKYEGYCFVEFWKYRAGVEGTRTFITNNNFSTLLIL
jgi:hypothetical protein